MIDSLKKELPDPSAVALVDSSRRKRRPLTITCVGVVLSTFAISCAGAPGPRRINSTTSPTESWSMVCGAGLLLVEGVVVSFMTGYDSVWRLSLLEASIAGEFFAEGFFVRRQPWHLCRGLEESEMLLRQKMPQCS
jgi:hypothetical protein